MWARRRSSAEPCSRAASPSWGRSWRGGCASPSCQPYCPRWAVTCSRQASEAGAAAAHHSPVYHTVPGGLSHAAGRPQKLARQLRITLQSTILSQVGCHMQQADLRSWRGSCASLSNLPSCPQVAVGGSRQAAGVTQGLPVTSTSALLFQVGCQGQSCCVQQPGCRYDWWTVGRTSDPPNSGEQPWSWPAGWLRAGQWTAGSGPHQQPPSRVSWVCRCSTRKQACPRWTAPNAAEIKAGRWAAGIVKYATFPR